jgi:hypothetical protein
MKRTSLPLRNCDFVAAKSLIDLVASRLALRAPALRAATALTRPTRSAQRLPSGRHAVPSHDDIHLERDKLGRKLRKSIQPTFRGAGRDLSKGEMLR